MCIRDSLTFQATQKNKFDVFWDEQDTCQDPCDGVVSVYTSPESWWSVQTRPNHLSQLNWTNPITNKVLLEATVSGVIHHRLPQRQGRLQRCVVFRRELPGSKRYAPVVCLQHEPGAGGVQRDHDDQLHPAHLLGEH